MYCFSVIRPNYAVVNWNYDEKVVFKLLFLKTILIKSLLDTSKILPNILSK